MAKKLRLEGLFATDEHINSLIDVKIADLPSGGGSVPKPLTYDYMPEGYPSKSVQTVTLMEEQAVAFTDDGKSAKYYLTDPLSLDEGQTYIVSWDGTEYECVCGNINDILFIGNLLYANSGEDSGEPFSYDTYDNAFITFDGSPSHTISVKTTGEVVTPMAEEFLPAELVKNISIAQTTAENAQIAAETAQTTADENKEVLDGAFSSVATFTFDKQTSGRDTLVFNGYNYYKISDFNPSPSDVISFKGTRESGDELSRITTGNNCVKYGFFIIVASAGNCSIPVTETLTGNFTAPSAGLYAQYRENNVNMTAGTGEFALRRLIGNLPITSLFLRSSTSYSTKQFKLTVDDSGVPSFTNTEDSTEVWTPTTVTDDHINELINTALGVIENGSY